MEVHQIKVPFTSLFLNSSVELEYSTLFLNLSSELEYWKFVHYVYVVSSGNDLIFLLLQHKSD